MDLFGVFEVDEVYLDLDEMTRFLDETRKFRTSDDDKLTKTQATPRDQRVAKGAAASLPASRWRRSTTTWVGYSRDGDEIIESIRSTPNAPRRIVTDEMTLMSIRDKVRRHIKGTYVKRVDAPLNAPKPRLDCWMELNQ